MVPWYGPHLTGRTETELQSLHAALLPTVIQRFKTFMAQQCGTGVASSGWPRYPTRWWQHRFHEHVIRTERELTAIREYIVNNLM